MLDNLKAVPSKAKKTGLASLGALLILLPRPGTAPCGDIQIRSGPHQDTVIQVGPEAEFLHDEHQAARFETDQDNATTIRAEPVPRKPQPQAAPVIIIPEIHMREQQ